MIPTLSGQTCGAQITDTDLSKTLSTSEITYIRAAWLKYKLISFPDLPLNEDNLERFTICTSSLCAAGTVLNVEPGIRVSAAIGYPGIELRRQHR